MIKLSEINPLLVKQGTSTKQVITLHTLHDMAKKPALIQSLKATVPEKKHISPILLIVGILILLSFIAIK